MAGGTQEEAISKAGPKEAAERREAHGLAGWTGPPGADALRRGQ